MHPSIRPFIIYHAACMQSGSSSHITASLPHLQTCHPQELVTILIPICFRSRGLVRPMTPSHHGSVKIIIRYFFLHGRFRLKLSSKHTESVFTPREKPGSIQMPAMAKAHSASSAGNSTTDFVFLRYL